MNEEVLRTEHISKSFGRVAALRDASIHLCQRRSARASRRQWCRKVHPVEDSYRVSSAERRARSIFKGEEIELKSVSHARSLGIEPVYQDLALISELNVYRNMFLQREIMSNRFLGILDDRTMRERAIEQLDEMGVNIPNVDVEISKLSGGQRQAIAVARSVFANAKVSAAGRTDCRHGSEGERHDLGPHPSPQGEG